MISDWSGAALEFSFSRLKPVLFVDVPRKINNPDYLSLEIEPIEVSIRQNIGMVVPEEDLAQTGKYIKELMENADRFKDKIKQCREASVYNIGESGKAGAKELVRLLNA